MKEGQADCVTLRCLELFSNQVLSAQRQANSQTSVIFCVFPSCRKAGERKCLLVESELFAEI